MSLGLWRQDGPVLDTAPGAQQPPVGTCWPAEWPFEAGTHCSPFLCPALGTASHPALRQDQSPPAELVLAPHPGLQHLSLCPPVPPADLRLPLAAEARGALCDRRGRAFPKARQPAHVLPIPVQRRPGDHQKEEVGPAGGGQAAYMAPPRGVGSSHRLGARRGVGGAGLSLL